MNRYLSYKDSEVDWIGKIPNTWEVSRIKKHFKERKEKVSDLDFPPLSVTKRGILPQLDNVSKSDNHNDRKRVCKNDFVINSRSDRKGSSGMSVLDGSVSLINIVLEPKSITPKYSEYIFKSKNFIEEFFRNGKGIHWDLWSTRFSELQNIKIPIPSLFEQQQIVTFLDTKTSLIDSLIEKTQRKIELLKEKRTSLINEVVTKGLNPNVEMKDSGVEWIGEIPSGWEIIKGKYILKILTGNYPSEIIEDENGQNFVKVDDLNHLEDGFYLSNPKLKIQDFGMNTLEEGIILFPKRGMTIFTNKVVITKSRCFIDPNLMGIKVFDTFDKIFLFYLLTNRGLGDICDSSTIPQINNKHIYPLEFTNPPLQEQQQIVSYLDEQTQKIDKTISIEEKRIELLKEYRQSLISEVVTGKRKVV